MHWSTRLAKVRLWWNTARRLRWRQITARLTPSISQGELAGGPLPEARQPRAAWIRSIERPPTLLAPWEFSIFNRTRRWTCPADWEQLDAEALWMQHLHYFEDLAAAGARDRRDWHRVLLAQWLADHPRPRRPGWHPFATSKRLVNWAVAAWNGFGLSAEALANAAMQTRDLSRKLEFRVLGNHLLVNAKALVFMGAFFEGHEAAAWRRRGLALLDEQLAEQILPDGGHFELSPMYHGLVLEDLLDLINLRRSFPEMSEFAARDAAWRRCAQQMLRWLAVMTHPDGTLPRFNDTAEGMSGSPAELRAYAARLGLIVPATPNESVVCLSESGYVRLQDERTVALLDVGKIGPDYLPAHAHADSLSFEVSWCGRRCVVNSGVSQYEEGPERLRQRGTAAHSTLLVDGQDSSEVWGAFRVAQRAYPLDMKVDSFGGRGARVRCGHNGYRRLPGRVTHWRTWSLTDGVFEIVDELTGRWQRAVARCLSAAACCWPTRG